MEVVFFSLNISGDLGLSAFPLSRSLPAHLDRQTERGSRLPSQRSTYLGGYARRTNHMSELFMSCSISGIFVCIQPLPAMTASL